MILLVIDLIFFTDQNAVVCLAPTKTLPSTFIEGFVQFIRQVFLPQGYPESVSDDYFSYQLWDTVQVGKF